MLPLDVTTAIQAIHNAPPRLVLAFAGAGSQALYWLHALAGSSRTVLEARDCYAPSSLAELIGGVPTQAVNLTTGRLMADWAYRRAVVLSTGAWPLLGVGCTAALATDRTRRGADRAVVVVQSVAAAQVYELTMAQGQRERAAEEELTSRLLVLAIARACGVDEPPALDLLPGETLVEQHETAKAQRL